MPTAISVHSLQKKYERQIAIDGLSFEVDSNEFVAIVGPSGCGKSTTLRIVAGLERPSSGTVRASGEMVDGPIGNAAMVFQAPVLLPWRRTLSNVLFAAEMRGKRPGAFRERAQDLIALTGLDGFEHSYPHELSGGMQQRVAMCRALLLEPTILLMDEPFGALDVMTREKMGFELQRIWSETKNTVLFVTHSITEAVLLSDRVIVMTPRPGRAKAVIQVDLARPRDVGTLKDPAFVELCATVREAL